MTHDPTHPDHYRQHPSGIECIVITEHMGFCVGNAIKYLWRAGLKGNALVDLRKARWYVEREIARLEAQAAAPAAPDLPPDLTPAPIAAVCGGKTCE